MDETGSSLEHWQSEIARLTELRDGTTAVQDALNYTDEILTEFRERLDEIDQPLDELQAMPQDQRNEILETRRKIVRALCDKATIRSDGRVKLIGVIDGSESAQFDSVSPMPVLR